MTYDALRQVPVLFGGFSFVAPAFSAETWEIRSLCIADYNGDGLLDPDDLADFIAAFFDDSEAHRTDFNGDGFVDPDDLADYIHEFFAMGSN